MHKELFMGTRKISQSDPSATSILSPNNSVRQLGGGGSENHHQAQARLPFLTIATFVITKVYHSCLRPRGLGDKPRSGPHSLEGTSGNPKEVPKAVASLHFDIACKIPSCSSSDLPWCRLCFESRTEIALEKKPNILLFDDRACETT